MALEYPQQSRATMSTHTRAHHPEYGPYGQEHRKETSFARKGGVVILEIFS